MIHPDCFLGVHGFMRHPKPCTGRLVRCHLIPKQVIKRVDPQAVWDPRSFVPGCGGLTGVGGHHGELDLSRSLRLSRDVLPEGLEEFAAELGLGWWLAREYGERSGERAA